MDDARRARAAKRSNWVGHKTNLSGQTDAAIVRHGTPAERVAMVWQITLDLWASSGRPLPTYERHEMPGRVFRRGERPDE